jgi:hypothetical protein
MFLGVALQGAVDPGSHHAAAILPIGGASEFPEKDL